MIKRRAAGKLFVISAPSGCGKTTLCNRLLSDGLGLANSVSMTTRAPRPGEVNGVDYIFVTKKRFGDMIRRHDFLEYEENFGNFYGTPRAFVEGKLGNGESVLLSIDVKGAMKVKRSYPGPSVLIFLLPPSIDALKERLDGRRSEEPDVIRRRLALAKKEISYKKKYDYTIVNDDLEKAYRRLKDIIVGELKKQPKGKG